MSKDDKKPDRVRVKHDDKDKQFQIKGKTTRKLLKNDRDGTVKWNEYDR